MQSELPYPRRSRFAPNFSKIDNYCKTILAQLGCADVTPFYLINNNQINTDCQFPLMTRIKIWRYLRIKAEIS